MRRIVWLLALLPVLLALVFAAGCGGDDDDEGSSETGARSATGGGGEASGEPISIGISLPLTGDFSQPGGEAQRGYEVWRDDGQRRRRPARPARSS